MVTGMARSTLSRKLIRARETLGLTLSQACERMPNTTYGTLYHLEGRAKSGGKLRAPAVGEEMQLRTAVDLATVYWPDVALHDLMPSSKLDFEYRDPP